MKKNTPKFGQDLNALKVQSAVYKSFRWYQIALWAKGMTKANIQLQGFPSVHAMDYANHMQMLEVKVPALSKKVRGLSRLTICTLSLFLPSSLLPPERAAGPRRFLLLLQASLDLPRHYVILPAWLELIPPLTTAGTVPAVTHFLRPFRGLIENTFAAAAIFWLTAVGLKELRVSFVQSSKGFWGFFLVFFYPLIFWSSTGMCKYNRKVNNIM